MKKRKTKSVKRKAKPDIRYLNEMRKILYDKKWAKTAPNLELYYMYRGIKPRRSLAFSRTLRDRKKNGLRYDITIIPPKNLGEEFVKTAGHEHCGNFGEIYIVLKGKAIFLMQKQKKAQVEDVFAIKAKEKEIAIIPPGYGHITINPFKKELKMANWMAKNVKSDYNIFQKMKGACYFYILRPGSGQAGWIKNKNYKKVPKLRFEKPIKKMPKNLDFLKGK